MADFNGFIEDPQTRESLSRLLQELEVMPQQSFEVPLRLFKYTALNQYVVKNLKNSSFTLSSPFRFNDFYDAKYLRQSLDENCHYEERRRFLCSTLGIPYQPVSDSTLRSQSESEDMLLYTVMNAGMRLGCLSEHNDSILMWSHYADKHRGICVEYDLSDTLYRKLYPVIYTAAPVNCIHWYDLDPRLEQLISILNKYDVWEYENEWRILHYDPNSDYLNDLPNFPKPKAIYLGRCFLNNWISNTGQKCTGGFEHLIELYEYIKENQIAVFIMESKVMSYEITPKAIDVDSVFIKIYEFLRR